MNAKTILLLHTFRCFMSMRLRIKFQLRVRAPHNFSIGHQLRTRFVKLSKISSIEICQLEGLWQFQKSRSQNRLIKVKIGCWTQINLFLKQNALQRSCLLTLRIILSTQRRITPIIPYFHLPSSFKARTSTNKNSKHLTHT